MAYTPFRYRRDEFDMDRERADDAADRLQEQMHAAIRNAPPTPAEIQAAAIKAEDERQILKYMPIGTTIEQARKRGWTE